MTLPAIKISGGACSTAGDSLDVTFKRNDGNEELPSGHNPGDIAATHLVYVTGGSKLTKVKPRIGKSGLDESVIKLEDDDAIGYADQTINVTKSMADDDGMVYLIGYGNETTNATKLTAASTTFKADADFAVMVQFVDGPVRAFDADRDDKTFITNNSDDDVDGSTLEVPTGTKRIGMGDDDKDGYDDGMYAIPANDADEITVTATIKDAKGRPVSGGDKDSRVDFSVMYAEGSDITDNAKDFDSRVEVKKGANTAALEVSGWESSEKAVKVTVSATFTGPTAPDGLDLGMVTLVRIAETASSADFATYSCATKTDATASKGCAAGYAASADMRFGREEHFVVYGQFNDSLGSKVERTPQLKLSDAAKDALESAGSATGYSASAGALLVMVKEEAAFGDYTIMVTNGRSGDAELTQELTIYVAGPPAEYMVDPTAVSIPAAEPGHLHRDSHGRNGRRARLHDDGRRAQRHGSD